VKKVLTDAEQHPSPEADPAGLTHKMVGLFAEQI
jgi:hypothetical protein